MTQWLAYFRECNLASVTLRLLLAGPWSAAVQAVGARTDVSRFGAQVVAGVGFIGAGAIIVTRRQRVKGLTTAAGLWAAASTREASSPRC